MAVNAHSIGRVIKTEVIGGSRAAGDLTHKRWNRIGRAGEGQKRMMQLELRQEGDQPTGERKIACEIRQVKEELHRSTTVVPHKLLELDDYTCHIHVCVHA